MSAHMSGPRHSGTLAACPALGTPDRQAKQAGRHQRRLHIGRHGGSMDATRPRAGCEIDEDWKQAAKKSYLIN